MTQKNARLITSLIDEMLLVSLNESSEEAKKENLVEINTLMRGVMKEAEGNISTKTTIQYDTTLADNFTILSNEYHQSLLTTSSPSLSKIRAAASLPTRQNTSLSAS